MSTKKKYEFREKKNYNRESDGLKQRRLKEKSRWKFNPNKSYESEDDFDEDIEDLYDEYKDHRWVGL
jgi:hypothetical protein